MDERCSGCGGPTGVLNTAALEYSAVYRSYSAVYMDHLHLNLCWSCFWGGISKCNDIISDPIDWEHIARSYYDQM